MKSHFLRTVSIAAATVLMVGCGGSSSGAVKTPEIVTQSQGTAPANKGPFALGATVTAYKLNSDGSRGTETNSTQTTDDKGTFTISVPWEGPTELNIIGEYLNEVTGTYMNDGDLSAIVDMKSDANNSLGINIFTHMAVSIIRKKMTDNIGADFEVLKEESKEVIAEQFNLKLDDDTALEDLDMTSSDEEANIQLLQVSAALMSTPNPAETLANIAEDISDGEVDDEGQATLEELDEEMEKVDIVAVAQNIENNVENSVVPTDFNVLNGTLAWDSTISFPEHNDAEPSRSYSSLEVTINGVIGDSAELTIANGTYVLNGASASSTKSTVSNGDRLKVIGTSSANYNAASEVAVTIGGETIPFVIQTQADPDANDDAVPNEFDFGFKKNVAADSAVNSEAVLVSGINKATAISIDNGTFTVNGASATEVNNGDSVVVTLTSGVLGESKKATVTIGGVKGKFIVSSVSADSMPIIVGSFQSVAAVEKEISVVSNEIEVTGINVAIPVSIAGGEFSINGAGYATTGLISNGDKVKVEMTSSTAFDTRKEVSLNIGTFVVPFAVETKSDRVVPDTVPNTFSFNAQTTRVANSDVQSESITVSSINEAVAITVQNGQYSINGGDFTSTSSTVNEGDKVVVQVNSADYGLSKSATVSIGGVSSTFTVVTIKDDVLDSISFASKSAVARGTVVESDTVTVSGVNVPMAVSIVGGEYSIDGGDYVSSLGTVTEGQTLKVRVTSASSPLASTSSLLSVGNLQLPFIVTTQASIPPVSVVDIAGTLEDTMVTIDVLGNDSDEDGDSLTIVELSTPSNGTATVVAGKINYTPNANFVGTDTFTYRANDGAVKGNVVVVTVTVTAVNDAPIAAENNVTTDKFTEISIDVLSNNSDSDGDSLTLVSISTPSSGTASIVDAKILYVPSGDFNGTVSFTYVVSDGNLVATGDVNVEVVNAQSKLITVLNILDTTNFETDDIASTLDEVKTTLDNANALDKEAQIGLALFTLAEITNSEEIGDLVNISLDSSVVVDYADYLPAILEGMSRNTLDSALVDNITDLSGTSTTVMHNVVLQLQDINQTLGEAFVDENYVFTYDDINITNNQSKMLRAGILAVASKLEYISAFNYLSEDDIQVRTTTLNGVTAEYDTISSNPVSVFNRSDVGSLSSVARLGNAKALLLESLAVVDMIDPTKEDIEARDDIEDVKIEASKIALSLNGTAPYIVENDENAQIEKIYINLAALYEEATVLDMTHTVGHDFSYENNHYYHIEEYRTGDYNQAVSQFYNDAMAVAWIAEDGTVISYVEDQMERPTMEIRPTIPTGTDSHISSVIQKVELIENAETITYQGDDVLRYFFNYIDLDGENIQYHYQNSEDINMTYRVSSESMIPFDGEATYNFELLYAPSWLQLTKLDVDAVRVTADAGQSGQACFSVRVTDNYGHTQNRGECIYVEVPSALLNLSDNYINLNQGDSRSITLTTDNISSINLTGYIPDFVTLVGNEIQINPTATTEVQHYEIQIEANSSVSDQVIYEYLQIDVNLEGSNHSPIMNLTQYNVRLNTVNAETASVEIDANDEDGDTLTYTLSCYGCYEDQVPSFVTLSNNSIIVSPNSGDEGSYDIQVQVSDGNDGYASQSLHIEVVSEASTVHVEIDFSHIVANGSYDNNTTVDPSPLAGTTMYGLRFSSHDGNSELEVEKFTVNTDTISVSRSEDLYTPTWSTPENMPYTLSNGEFLIDEDADGSDDFKIKYLGSVSDLTFINEIAGEEIFGADTEAYHFIYQDSEEEEEFIWFNQAGMEQFLQFLQSQQSEV